MKNKKINTMLVVSAVLVGFLGLFSFCPLKRQGIEGNVQQLKGDQMPSPDLPVTGRGRPFACKIAVFEPTKITQTQLLPTNGNGNQPNQLKTDCNGCNRLPGTFQGKIVSRKVLGFYNGGQQLLRHHSGRRWHHWSCNGGKTPVYPARSKNGCRRHVLRAFSFQILSPISVPLHFEKRKSTSGYQSGRIIQGLQKQPPSFSIGGQALFFPTPALQAT